MTRMNTWHWIFTGTCSQCGKTTALSVQGSEDIGEPCCVHCAWQITDDQKRRMYDRSGEYLYAECVECAEMVHDEDRESHERMHLVTKVGDMISDWCNYPDATVDELAELIVGTVA